MGQTCTTETCCSYIGGKGEVRGDIGQQSYPTDINDSFKLID